MNQNALISEICDQADGFLAGVTEVKEAKAGIEEWLTIHHPNMAEEAKGALVTEALRILETEGFFEAEAGSEG